VKVSGWGNAAAARQEILDCVARYKSEPNKPNF
jgi:inorganic pyrophosphatase